MSLEVQRVMGRATSAELTSQVAVRLRVEVRQEGAEAPESELRQPRIEREDSVHHMV